MPLYHLAALSILGDAERLNEYLIYFQNGNRLGFVPYITEDMIYRALNISRINRKQEKQ